MRRPYLLFILLVAGPAAAQCGWDVQPGLVCDRQWRAPVTSETELPATDNLTGDIRLALDRGLMHWTGTAWQPLIDWYDDGDGSSLYLGNTAGGTSPGAFNTTCVGSSACGNLGGGNSDVYVGASAALYNSGGDKNVMVGAFAGESSAGSSNVYLGYQAGRTTTGSNQLIITNVDTPTPLISGDFAALSLRLANAVTIRDGGVVHLDPLATPPSSPVEGDIYYSSAVKDLCVYDGSAWTGMKGPC